MGFFFSFRAAADQTETRNVIALPWQYLSECDSHLTQRQQDTDKRKSKIRLMTRM
jgi:hypothetical protein